MEKDIFGHRVRLRHIHCFVAVAQERNLGRAAEKLRLTQPAISKTLAELEQLAGVRLFQRGRQGAQLTRDGEAFLAHAVTVLEALDAAVGSVGAGKAPQAEAIHIGALPSVAPDLLPRAIADFRRIHPHAGITIQTSTNAMLLAMLKSGELDLVLGRMSDPQLLAGLSFELLYMEPLLMAVRPGHPLAASHAPSLTEVTGCPLIVSTRGTVPRHNAESYLQSRGLRLPAGCIETLSVPVARLLAQRSNAVWITPAGAVREDLESGMLAQLKVDMAGTEEMVGLVTRKEARNAAADLFAQMLRELGRQWHARSL
jgi:LysR family transcriptional regulator, pca operon transcriptional activator